MTSTRSLQTRGRSVLISLSTVVTRPGSTLPPLDSAGPSNSSRTGALWRPAEYRPPLWNQTQPGAALELESFRAGLGLDLAARPLRSRSRSVDAATTALGPTPGAVGRGVRCAHVVSVHHHPRPPLPYLQPRPALAPSCCSSASLGLGVQGQRRSVGGVKAKEPEFWPWHSESDTAADPCDFVSVSLAHGRPLSLCFSTIRACPRAWKPVTQQPARCMRGVGLLPASLRYGLASVRRGIKTRSRNPNAWAPPASRLTAPAHPSRNPLQGNPRF